MSRYVYSDEHGILSEEFLSRGSLVKETLKAEEFSPETFEAELAKQLGYVYARIPVDYCGGELSPKISRTVLLELTRYVEKAAWVRKYGLGLTLISPRPVFKLQPLYVTARRLVDEGFSCFTALYDELIFWLKETREYTLLGEELRDRFGVDFFFLMEVPEEDELSNTLRQDLLARFGMRKTRGQPTLFAINSSSTSLNSILPNSFLGRLILPFSNLNKPLIVEDLGDVDSMFEDKWRKLDG